MNRERFCRAKLRARAVAAANFLHRLTRFQNVARDDQARHSSASRRFQALVILACSGLITTSAQAHPHVWATIRTELVYAPDASVDRGRARVDFRRHVLGVCNAGNRRPIPRASSRERSCNRWHRSTSTRLRNMLISPTPKSTGRHKGTPSVVRQTIGSITIPRRRS